MTNENTNTQLDASFSTLIFSIGSNAAISLGLSADPATGKFSTNKEMASFNINLLKTLQEKTKNNLSNEEASLIKNMIADLQLKFIDLK